MCQSLHNSTRPSQLARYPPWWSMIGRSDAMLWHQNSRGLAAQGEDKTINAFGVRLKRVVLGAVPMQGKWDLWACFWSSRHRTAPQQSLQPQNQLDWSVKRRGTKLLISNSCFILVRSQRYPNSQWGVNDIPIHNDKAFQNILEDMAVTVRGRNFLMILCWKTQCNQHIRVNILQTQGTQFHADDLCIGAIFTLCYFLWTYRGAGVTFRCVHWSRQRKVRQQLLRFLQTDNLTFVNTLLLGRGTVGIRQVWQKEGAGSAIVDVSLVLENFDNQYSSRFFLAILEDFLVVLEVPRFDSFWWSTNIMQCVLWSGDQKRLMTGFSARTDADARLKMLLNDVPGTCRTRETSRHDDGTHAFTAPPKRSRARPPACWAPSCVSGCMFANKWTSSIT